LASSATTPPTQDVQAAAQPVSARRVWTRILSTILFFAAFEGVLFHSGLYSLIVEPASTTGFMELQLRNEIRRPKANRNQVLAVGDSRMPLLPRIVNEAGGDYTFATMALGGTSPRTWYYALRAVDPKASNYAAIVIPSADYNEPDNFDYVSEREVDLHYLIGRLGLRDLGEFPWTYRGKKAQWMIVRGMILKGTIYKRDFIEFLDHPIDRIVKAQYYNHDSAGWYYVYGGNDKNLTGLQIDWKHQTVQAPDRITASERNQIQGMLFPAERPGEGRETAYLRYWYGRIVDYYRGSGTKLIFIRVPRAPLSPPDEPPKMDSAVRQIASQPNVVVLNEGLFNALERPELFWDAWHMNRAGMEQFSRDLATAVDNVLGRPRPKS
jgi:hypothetical protein